MIADESSVLVDTAAHTKTQRLCLPRLIAASIHQSWYQAHAFYIEILVYVKRSGTYTFFFKSEEMIAF